MIGKIKYLINKKKTFNEICDELQLKSYELIGIIKQMNEKGHLVDYIDGEIIKLNKPVINDLYELKNDLEHLKLLIISDTHLCNNSDRLDILNYLYDKAGNKDVKHVLHVGDLVDGIYTNRPQHIYELKKHGYDEHVEYVSDKYPRYNGKTYFITGNHEHTYTRNGGSDIGRAISKNRDDMIYLGPDAADLKIGKLKIRLFHGAGGPAYSKSYKLQRYVETIAEKPHLALKGHDHTAFYMNYQDIHCFQVGALLDDTLYSRSMGFKNEKSCWWVDVWFDNKGQPYIIQPQIETFGNARVKK